MSVGAASTETPTSILSQRRDHLSDIPSSDPSMASTDTARLSSLSDLEAVDVAGPVDVDVAGAGAWAMVDETMRSKVTSLALKVKNTHNFQGHDRQELYMLVGKKVIKLVKKQLGELGVLRPADAGAGRSELTSSDPMPDADPGPVAVADDLLFEAANLALELKTTYQAVDSPDVDVLSGEKLIELIETLLKELGPRYQVSPPDDAGASGSGSGSGSGVGGSGQESADPAREQSLKRRESEDAADAAMERDQKRRRDD